MPLFIVKDLQGLVKLCFLWGAAIPIVLMASMKIGPWFAAVQYYGLPFLFLGHFLYVVAAFAAIREKLGATKIMTGLAAIPSIASGVLALSLIPSINPPDMEPGSLTMIRVALYGFYGLYILGNAYIVMSVFKVKAAPVDEAVE